MHIVIKLDSDSAAARLWGLLKTNWREMLSAGKPLTVTLTDRKPRNNEQNRLYWATLKDIAENAWVSGKQYSSEAWHEHFKREFIGLDEMPNGQTCGISTTTLSVEQFAGYITRIQLYAAENFGIE
jgi:hypothetical protein